MSAPQSSTPNRADLSHLTGLASALRHSTLLLSADPAAWREPPWPAASA